MIGEVRIIKTWFTYVGTKIPSGQCGGFCVKITTGHHGWQHGCFMDSSNFLLLTLLQECFISSVVVGHGGLWLYPKSVADLEPCREMAESIVQTNPAWLKKLKGTKEHEQRIAQLNGQNYHFRQAS